MIFLLCKILKDILVREIMYSIKYMGFFLFLNLPRKRLTIFLNQRHNSHTVYTKILYYNAKQLHSDILSNKLIEMNSVF